MLSFNWMVRFFVKKDKRTLHLWTFRQKKKNETKPLSNAALPDFLDFSGLTYGQKDIRKFANKIGRCISFLNRKI
jgi:hypothetical protein